MALGPFRGVEESYIDGLSPKARPTGCVQQQQTTTVTGKMRIWHFGDVHWSPASVNGVNMAVRDIAREQVSAGHSVSVIIEGSPCAAASEYAATTGVELLTLRKGRFGDPPSIRSWIEKARPDIVHMHSVFIPQQIRAAATLRRSGIPYITTPHGGLAKQVLARNRRKKALYSWLFERPRIAKSQCCSAVAPGEEPEIRAFAPDFKGLLSWVPNPVACPAEHHPHAPVDEAPTRPQIVFLGRFDVVHKGIDLMVELARRLPEADFNLYGEEDGRTASQLQHLRQIATPNVHFEGPVFGGDKTRVLESATLYLQPSRWEAFGISVAEAMCLGVPCAITATMNMAAFFKEHDLGLIIPGDPAIAAGLLRQALKDEAKLRSWSQLGKRYAHERFQPTTVAEQYVSLYRRCINESFHGRVQSTTERKPLRVQQ